VHAPLLRIALIIGAGVSVVAVERGPGYAVAQFALISEGAGITVVAQGRVDEVVAAPFQVAPVIGAWVVILAVEGLSRQALPSFAMV